MLHLRIGLPGGRYYAAAADDPRQPEWPPHPSRVFSALVAAAYAGGRKPSADERFALQWLEAAPPPDIYCPAADLRPAPDSFVPVNDPNTRIRAPKRQSHGVLLPNRQARQFPAAFLLDEPEVRLRWAVEAAPATLAVLDAVAARLTHLGTSHAFATARFEAAADVAAGSPWVPREGGRTFLRVPRPGRLEELDRLADSGHGTLRRPPPTCEVLVPYAQAQFEARVVPPPLHDWVALRVADVAWGADTAHTLARALRRAVMSVLGDAAPPLVHGHDADAAHAAWLPLPDVGHPHARGRIRGVALALPMAAPAADRAAALAALSRVHVLALPDGQQARLQPVLEGPETPLALRSAVWLGPSRDWSSVTPVLLDHPPKRSDPALLANAVASSLVLAGFPSPESVRLTRASDFTGAPGALDVPTRIPRWHARVRFAQAVHGPVIAGRWRHFGIGLFRPTPPELCP
jgi:CRISPR-associated protein Csb2